MSNPFKIIKDLMGLSPKRKLEVCNDNTVTKDDTEYFIPKRVVIVSGYFSPAHSGHIEYFKMAKEFAGEDGIVYAIVNSDAQSILKKKYSFVPEDDRLAVVGSCKYIDKAILSVDTDRSVCATIKMLCYMAKKGCTFHMPTHFANGGDVTSNSKCPEEPICKANNIELVYGLGDKIQSSSWIIENSVKQAYEEIYGCDMDHIDDEEEEEEEDEEEEMDEEKMEEEEEEEMDDEEEDTDTDINTYYDNVDVYSEDENEIY